MSMVRGQNIFFVYRTVERLRQYKFRGEDPALTKTGSGALYLKRREMFKSLKHEYFGSLNFRFHTYDVRRPL